MDIAYAVEKLYDTVRILTDHKGDIKARLKEATTDSFVRLTMSDIPPKAQKEYASIYDRLTSTQGKDGAFYASIDAMTEEEASRLARDIRNLNDMVEQIWRNR